MLSANPWQDVVVLLDGSGSMCMSSTTTHKGVSPGLIIAANGNPNVAIAKNVGTCGDIAI